jgi:hypothetical protein
MKKGPTNCWRSMQKGARRPYLRFDTASDKDECRNSLTDAQLRARRSSCAGEGARLIAANTRIERAIVKQLAKKWMGRLLRTSLHRR